MKTLNDHSWFRSSEWDEKAQIVFEEHLGKTRGAFNKAQYLRIKAYSLQNSQSINAREAGRELFKRIINTYPDEKSQVVQALEGLGKSYEKDGYLGKAEEYYRKCIEYFQNNLHSTGNTIRSPLYLAELIEKANLEEKYNDAQDILDRWIERMGQLTLNVDIYRYNILRARLSQKLHNKQEAVSYAKQALAAAEAGQNPQFIRHPDIGLIKIENKIVDEMTGIINGNSTTGFIARLSKKFNF
jgi:tetratricopeptide (TPR) repeat protein